MTNKKIIESKIVKSRNSAQLLLDFFAFYNSYDFEEFAIQISTQQLIKRNELKWGSKHTIQIIDPFEYSQRSGRNLTGLVKAKGFYLIIKYI